MALTSRTQKNLQDGSQNTLICTAQNVVFPVCTDGAHIFEIQNVKAMGTKMALTPAKNLTNGSQNSSISSQSWCLRTRMCRIGANQGSNKLDWLNGKAAIRGVMSIWLARLTPEGVGWILQEESCKVVQVALCVPEDEKRALSCNFVVFMNYDAQIQIWYGHECGDQGYGSTFLKV